MTSLMQAAPLVAPSRLIARREVSIPGDLKLQPELSRVRSSSSSWISVSTSASAAAGAIANRQARRRSRYHAATRNSLSPMAELLAKHIPILDEVAELKPSMEEDGLGLFARKRYVAEDIICEIPLDSEILMRPKDALSQKLEAGDWGALAFQVLKAWRGDAPSPWKDWIEAGARAPDTHPLKLLLSDPEAAKRIWSSTTCGGRMASMALEVRDDMEQLSGGGATLEEWTEFLSLVLSRSVCEDASQRPMLVMGLDLMQASQLPTARIELAERQASQGFFGIGASGPKTFVGLQVVAEVDIEVGDELTLRYMPADQPGRYLERYGYLPRFFDDAEAEAAVELSFAAVDPEDYFADVKASLLEDLNISSAPMKFVFSSSPGGILPPADSENWFAKGDINRMVHIVRYRTIGGADAFLMEGVFITELWRNCQFRISKPSEILVCQTVVDEVDRWLARFDALEESGPEPDDKVSKFAAIVRNRERALLNKLRGVFVQEQVFTNMDRERIYWIDRQMDVVFPERKVREDRMY